MKMQNLKQISIQFVKGVGPAKAKLFFNLGVESIEDLLYFFPRRYEDRRNITPIAQVQVGENQTITGKVAKINSRKSWHTKKHVLEVVLDDGGGRIFCVWFNQPYLVHYFKEDKQVVCFGKVDMYNNRLQMVSPEYEVMEETDGKDPLSLRRIVPVYPLTRGVTQRYLRKTVRQCLDKYKEQLVDELPVALRNKHLFWNIKRSIEALHFPQDFSDQEEALKRVSFEEFYFFQISIILRRMSIARKPGVAHRITDADMIKFISGFPFELTKAQKRVLKEISEDMRKPVPMLRLLQGDVGSGKTLVALFGCFAAFLNSKQSALMAPTEILARQHYENIQKMVSSGALKGMRCVLLTSSLKKRERDDVLVKIKNGQVDVVVGTHALITDDVVFKNLSFAVIDEQHKFGVRQRALLSEKGNNPDVLIMTATPIPRTLCITLYGDLDLSVIDEMPPGRGAVKTQIFSEENVAQVYNLVRQKVKEGRQAYIVYPIIDESESLDLKAAQDMYKQFKKQEFKDLRVGLIHGQMKKDEAQNVMSDFKNQKIDVLVATTVLEVGVDVPNATVMVIEHAGRFGLSQLHQLRGRIGRGQKDSDCLLVNDDPSEEALRRLKAIKSTTDGFKIAEYDLEFRGPGRYFGRHQHGLNELKVANPSTQIDILKLARKEAEDLLKEDPQLVDEKHQHILKIIKERYPTYLQMVKAG